MPREMKVLVYQFDELSSKAKEKAREWYREGALEHEWWDSICEDAMQIGIEVKAFDLDRFQLIKGKFISGWEPKKVAQTILENHGDSTETYKIAREYLGELRSLEDNHASFDRESNEDFDPTTRREMDRIEGKIEDLDIQFLKDVLSAYWKMLHSEMEYRLSDETVDEEIRANEYEFLASGKRA